MILLCKITQKSETKVVFLQIKISKDMTEYKRLTRSRTDCRIAGVCGGIAQYLNIDPTVVRIVFLVLLLMGGGGGLIYLIVWLCAPQE